ncbi:MAG: hypothetical protein M1828_006501 [Chrysothrix sp. TS-e1954]|nr:MAG: hypothetical protein M1828_006501 [Chrysothrix sp. TS-e1954]
MADLAQLQELSQDQQQDEVDQNGTKRKRQDDGAQQPRAKRNRYISIACNECKRRKIKCNGEAPCQRCGNLQLECVYAPNCCNNNFKDTLEFKQMHAHIMSLQDQVDTLWHSLNSLRTSLGHEIPQHEMTYNYGGEQARANTAPQAPMVIDPALHRSKSSPQQSRFQGPTSSAYSFGIARSSLQHMGVTSPEDGLDDDGTIQSQVPPQNHDGVKEPHYHLHPSLHAISALTKDEALRLCQIYEDEMGLMYPVVDFSKIKQYATLLFGLADSGMRRTLIVQGKGDALEDPDLDLVRLVLAIALVCESSGHNDLATSLYDGTSYKRKDGFEGNIDIQRIQIMILAAMYHFHTDDEGLSWRIIGVTARACVELGLHRSETYARLFQDDQDRAAALKVFWSVYVLDRRWSFGTGMSFALSDSDIDPALPKPTDSSPYLAAMIAYSEIASKVWQTYTKAGDDNLQSTSSKEQMGFLDYQIKQWHESLPASLQYVHPQSQEALNYRRRHPNDPEAINANGGRARHRLRVVLYLRLNQMRILIYRPILHSATSIANAGTTAQTVVDIARDTIGILSHLNQTSDIYRAQQMQFNYFLVSALGLLFLAVSHAPMQFSASCRNEFYTALELVRGLSATSVVSRRLWATVKGLKEIGPKLGLYARASDSDDVQDQRHPQEQSRPRQDGADHRDTQNSAMALASLAGHRVDENAFFAAHQQGTNQHNDSAQQATSGRANSSYSQTLNATVNGMANDLTSLFEAAGGYGMNGQSAVSSASGAAINNVQVIQENGQMPNAAAIGPSQGGAGMGMAYGNEDEFGRIMKDLF